MEDFETRREKFREHLKDHKIILSKELQKSICVSELKYTCPCCGFPTLGKIAGHEICKLCNWQDDGHGYDNPKIIAGGPNYEFSLSRARIIFQRFLDFGILWKKKGRPFYRVRKELIDLFYSWLNANISDKEISQEFERLYNEYFKILREEIKNYENSFKKRKKITVDKKFEKLPDWDKLQYIHKNNLNFFWDPKKNEMNFDLMSKSQIILYCIFVITDGVENGGFVQFFQNTQDNLFEKGYYSFWKIKDLVSFKIFEEATDIYYRNRDFLSEDNLDAELSEQDKIRLEELDEEFIQQRENRDKLLKKYALLKLKDYVVEA